MAKTAPTVEGWKEHHPWLVWDGDFDNGMACASCLATGKTGDAFTAEGGCTNFMLKSLQAHEKVHHKGFGVAGSAQAQAESASEAASVAALKAAARAEGSKTSSLLHAQRLAWTEVAYSNSKHPTSSDKMFPAALAAFDRGVKRLGSAVASTAEKRHPQGAAAATEAFSGVLSAEQLARIMLSPVIGIACDESTGVSVTEQLVIFIYYIYNGECCAEFFEMRDLHGASADQIVAAIIASLNERCPGLADKLIVLDSDGCSVMFGKDGGVGAKLRARDHGFMAYLLQLHCAAHKLHLGVGEGLDTPESRVVDRLLSGTYGVFSNSGLRREGLEKVHGELDAIVAEGTAVKKKKKMKSAKRHIKVRWLSRAASIDSIVDPLDALIVYLHELKASKSKRKAGEEEAPDEDDEAEIAESGRMSLDELVAAYSDFEVVAMLHFLGDVCEQLAALSASLQGSKLDVHTVLSNIDGLVDGLSSSYPQSGPMCWGPRMTKLLRRVPNLLGTCDIPIANAKHHIKFTKEKRDRFYQAARDSSELLVAALRERMPDSPIIFSLLKMFDARQLPEGVLPADYGNEDVETVLEHFAPKAKAAEAKTAADAEPSNDELQAAAKEASARAAKVSVDDYVDADKLRAEWVRFKFSFLKHQRGSDYRKLYKFLVTATDPSTIEMMMKLGGVLVIIALGNAISERGFSLMNHIKTKKKASLDKGLDPKMRVVCLGPTDEAGIAKLVDEATVTVFGRACPGRSQGAAVANDVRRAKKAKKDEAAAGSSSATIKAEGNAKVTRGGSTTQKLSSATFPREYRADVPMPPLDKSLKGKDVFYLIDDNTGSGYKFHRYTVAKAKKPSRVGADGNDLAGVKFRFALQKGKKGESFKTCLPAEQYGTKKKWYMAVKK